LARVRVSIVGGGATSAVGRTHISALSMDRDWEIVSIVPSSEDVLENVPNALSQDVEVFENLEQLLDKSKAHNLDFVVNLTPSNLHFEHGRKILESGFNLIIEKPMSLSATESLDLINIARTNELKLYTIQNYSSFVMVMALKRFLEEKSIGKILHVYGRMLQQGFLRKVNGDSPKIQDWRLSDPNIPMVMHDLGSHLLHLVGFLTKSYPTKVIANYNKSTVYPNLVSSCELLGTDKDEISYNLTLGKSFLGNQNNFQIEIFGTRGSLKWDMQNSELLEFTDEEGLKCTLDRQWAEQKYPELLYFSRFKPGHSGGFVEALANYYIILKSEFQNSTDLNRYLTQPNEVAKYLRVMEACSQSVRNESWC
jgi:predicted dehydrogenase